MDRRAFIATSAASLAASSLPAIGESEPRNSPEGAPEKVCCADEPGHWDVFIDGKYVGKGGWTGPVFTIAANQFIPAYSIMTLCSDGA